MITDEGTSTYTVVARAASGCYFTPSGYCLVRRFPSSCGPLDIVLRTRRAPANGFSAPVPRGLWAEITGEAPDLNTAIEVFTGSAQTLHPILVLSANAPSENLSPEIAFNSSPRQREREYFQQFLPEERTLPFRRRTVPTDAVEAILQALGTHGDNERLHRAIVQYYQALQNWGPGQEIMALAHIYMGMEALTPVVLRREMQKQECSKEEIASSWNVDVRQLDSEVRCRILFAGDVATYRAVKKASDGFEHGFLSFPEIRATATQTRLAAASLLRRAIVQQMSLDGKIQDKLLDPPYNQPFALHFAKYLRGQLISEHEALAPGDQMYPRFIWSTTAKEAGQTDEGDPIVGFEETLSPRFGKEVSFVMSKVEVWGPNPYGEDRAARAIDKPIETPRIETEEESAFKINDKRAEPWVNAVGRLIVNLGGLEALSHAWLDRLRPQGDKDTFKIPLKDRAQTIVEILAAIRNSGLDSDSVIEAWTTVGEIANLRDSIIGHPLLFGWHGNATSNKPDFMGFPDATLAASSTDMSSALISFDSINQAVDKSVALARLLERQLESLKVQQPDTEIEQG